MKLLDPAALDTLSICVRPTFPKGILRDKKVPLRYDRVPANRFTGFPAAAPSREIFPQSREREKREKSIFLAPIIKQNRCRDIFHRYEYLHTCTGRR